MVAQQKIREDSKTKVPSKNFSIKPVQVSFEDSQHIQNSVDFEKKLKQAIIDRMDNKEKFLQTSDINSMVGQIKDAKMAIENELEDLKMLKSEISKINQESRIDANKVDQRIARVQSRLNVLRAINEEQINSFISGKMST